MSTNIIASLQRPLRKPAGGPALKCRRMFLRFFPRGFKDRKYFQWERGYKVAAHDQWEELLNRQSYKELLKSRKYREIAATAARIESKTNLLFSFEKMAFRDAVRETPGARIFAEELYELLYGRRAIDKKFETWCEAIAALPRKQTRVLTHPVVTIFPFIARPDIHIFLKPNTTKHAAGEYGFDFRYSSTPSWEVYNNLLQFAEKIRKDQRDLSPRDMIDLQSFIWVIGSDEYRHM